MATKVKIEARILKSAIAQAGFVTDDFVLQHPEVKPWLTEEEQPTVRQLEKFGKDVGIPFGYLLLDEIPEEAARDCFGNVKGRTPLDCCGL